MKDQHYPGVPMKRRFADHHGKGSKGINKMKAYSYNNDIRPIIRITQEPAANVGNVVDCSILLKETSDSLYSSPVKGNILLTKELSSHVHG
ncbi:hypothetical protein BK131_16185 [Paenibacillus amylolyticus]|uniref:Uncharacterized protein n=1 Tax=Paenibacillus amylolyticus TaxID=1451 RepID=A0A1R1BU85_PAEAM|nr:hypothetical protein [Paenibacillus amylolyticus]OMF13442.1 hypothetical protein BK131_16185 [Paenibacillus amylolyticus]